MASKKKPVRKKRASVPRNRNGGKWSESEYWGAVRSGIRSKFRYWKPAMDALNKVKRPYTGEDRRIKHEYQCANCDEWFVRKKVEIDHVSPAGPCKEGTVETFIKNLTPESPDAFQVLCKECHRDKSYRDRYGKERKK